MSALNALVEKVQTFLDLLISFSTGGQVTEEDFRTLRDELLNEPKLKTRLPRFVRTCRDLKQFWPFIKMQSLTYQGRREYLWKTFNPILEELEAEIPSPADKRVEEAVAALTSDIVHETWRDALQRRVDDPDGAITSARSLLESVCKHILQDKGVAYEDRHDLQSLYKLTAEVLSLAPSKQTEHILRRVTGACSTIVDGIGSMRNALGDSHGKGRTDVKPEPRHAELAVNLAGALAIFLVDTYDARRRGAT
jgi:hypothetical protein